jgi:hypothetical protein
MKRSVQPSPQRCAQPHCSHTKTFVPSLLQHAKPRISISTPLLSIIRETGLSPGNHLGKRISNVAAPVRAAALAGVMCGRRYRQASRSTPCNYTSGRSSGCCLPKLKERFATVICKSAPHFSMHALIYVYETEQVCVRKLCSAEKKHEVHKPEHRRVASIQTPTHRLPAARVCPFPCTAPSTWEAAPTPWHCQVRPQSDPTYRDTILRVRA